MLESTTGICCLEYGCKKCKTFPLYSDDGISCDECKDG